VFGKLTVAVSQIDVDQAVLEQRMQDLLIHTHGDVQQREPVQVLSSRKRERERKKRKI
jgi:hypothetical protein